MPIYADVVKFLINVCKERGVCTAVSDGRAQKVLHKIATRRIILTSVASEDKISHPTCRVLHALGIQQSSQKQHNRNRFLASIVLTFLRTKIASKGLPNKRVETNQDSLK